MPEKNKAYLGDGAFAERLDDGMLKITTSNGIVDTNTIYFNPEVLAAFLRFVGKPQ